MRFDHSAYLQYFTHHSWHGAALLLASTIACAFGATASAVPIEISEVQRLERGYDDGCFGWTLDAEAGVAVVGDPCNESSGGAAYAFALRPNGQWEESWNHIKGSGFEMDSFGRAVSMDAGRVVIGEPRDVTPGLLHFYQVLADGGLSVVGRYSHPPANTIPEEGFGVTLALDGETVVSGTTWGGKVYILENRAGDWVEVEKLAASSVFDVDGDTILIGAPQGAPAGAARALYRDSLGDWQEGPPVRPDDPFEGEGFGESVAIDGQRALISARGTSADDGAAAVAYVFERNMGGAWQQVSRLDETGGSMCTMGRTVALSGNIALVGCRADARPVAVFLRQSHGGWALVARLSGGGVVADSAFGKVMAIDGNWVIIGAPFQPHARSEDEFGVVYIFDLTPLIAPIENVNDYISLDPDPSTYFSTRNTSGCPTGFLGKFGFEAQLANISQSTLSKLHVEVAEVTRGNLVLMADGSTLEEGGIFPVPEEDDYSGGILSPGEYVDMPFTICLKSRKRFRFFVDVLGAVE